MSSDIEIISKLPYERPFLFVDSITSVDENGIEGEYKVREDEYFFQGHFPGNPVVPGVIITEAMAQIGLVSLGIFMVGDTAGDVTPVFSSSQVEFLNVARPGDLLKVKSEKIYFRLNKLKCKVTCVNGKEEIIAKGELSGMMIKQPGN